jgi:CRISPR associated protein Cas1
MVVVGQEEFRICGRSRRPPTDPLNALLSFLYSILAHNARSACEASGLDAAVRGCRPGRRFGLFPAAMAVALLAAPLFAPAGEPTKPISLHPDNPHYFLWRGKPTILITSGEHYGAVLNLDFDYTRYLGELKSKGLNLTRTFSGVYREIPSSFKITDNTLAPKPNTKTGKVDRSEMIEHAGGEHTLASPRFDNDIALRIKSQ